MIRRLAHVALSAVVVLSGATAAGAAAGLALATPTTTTRLPAAHVLAHTRTDCAVDHFDEAAQTTTARFTDLTDGALRCVLTGIGAPSYVPAEMARKSPGYGHAVWDGGTVDWQRDPTRGLTVTIHVLSAPSGLDTKETPDA